MSSVSGLSRPRPLPGRATGIGGSSSSEVSRCLSRTKRGDTPGSGESTRGSRGGEGKPQWTRGRSSSTEGDRGGPRVWRDAEPKPRSWERVSPADAGSSPRFGTSATVRTEEGGISRSRGEGRGIDRDDARTEDERRRVSGSSSESHGRRLPAARGKEYLSWFHSRAKNRAIRTAAAKSPQSHRGPPRKVEPRPPEIPKERESAEKYAPGPPGEPPLRRTPR